MTSKLHEVGTPVVTSNLLEVERHFVTSKVFEVGTHVVANLELETPSVLHQSHFILPHSQQLNRVFYSNLHTRDNI